MSVNTETLDKLRDRKHIGNDEFAKLFMDMVNSGGSRATDFAEVVTSEHRFLQGEAFTMFLFCIESWAKAYDNKRFDARNEAACKFSSVMFKALKEAGLY